MLEVDDEDGPIEIVTKAFVHFCMEGGALTNDIDALSAILAYAKSYASSPAALEREFVHLLKTSPNESDVQTLCEKHIERL